MKVRICLFFVFSVFYFGCSKTNDSKKFSIISIFPTSGPPGTAVVVKGAHFGIDPGDNVVRFNSDTATVLSSSEDSLLVVSPLSGISGPVTVSVDGYTATGPVYTYTADSVDVYASAVSYGVVYWKNGEEILLESTQGNIGGAFGIGVLDGDLYVGGNIHYDISPGYQAAYWKNGIKTVLSNPNEAGEVRALAISDNNIYMGGSENGSPVYWKNGVKQELPKWTGGNARVNALAIAGNDVYAAGYESGPENEEHLVYWKNGVQTVLGKRGVVNIGATSIAVNGTDIYVCGIDSGDVVYWKNGGRVVLAEYQEVNPAEANAIRIAGNSIYVAGKFGGDAVIWKDGVMIRLPKLSLSASATAICFYQSDVYIGGRDGSLPVYWKNGIEVPLCCGQEGIVTAMAVVKKK